MGQGAEWLAKDRAWGVARKEGAKASLRRSRVMDLEQELMAATWMGLHSPS